MPEIKATINEEIFNPVLIDAVRGYGRKRVEVIDELILKVIPKWHRVIMKKVPIVGRIFGYKFQIELQRPQKGEVHREEIKLIKGSKKVGQIHFIVKEEDGYSGLFEMLPKAKRPDYIG